MPDQDYERLYREEIGRRLDNIDRALRELTSRLDARDSYAAAEINKLRAELNDLRVEVRVNANTLTIKSSIWGGLTGLAAGIGMILIFIATHLFH